MEGQPPHCPIVVWLAHLSQSWSGNQSGPFSEGLCIDTHTSSVQGAMMTFTPVRLLLHRLPTFKASLATGVSHSRCVRPRLLWLPSCVKLEWQHHSTRFAGVGLSGTSSSHGKGHPTSISCLQGDWETSKTLQRASVMATEMPSTTPWVSRK